MDQHAGRIALLTSELAMGEGGEGHEGVTVLAGQFGLAQTFDYLFHQLRKVSGAFLVAKTKVVEFRCLFCSCQPICDQRGLAFSQYRGYPHCPPPCNLSSTL